MSNNSRELFMSKMQTVALIALVLFTPQMLFAANWTEEAAREEAFRDTRKKIDTSAYPSQDPNFAENQQAITAGKTRVADRYITVENAGYLVSELDESGSPKITTAYAPDGSLRSLRIFSSPQFPRTGTVYCGAEECPGPNNTAAARGELLYVHFSPAKEEAFYFDRDGNLDFHVKDGQEVPR